MNSISLRTRTLMFHQALIKTIKLEDQSDRTSFRNINFWLESQFEAGEFDKDIFHVVLDYAAEAALPTSRNPAAEKFLSIFCHSC